MTVIDLTAGPEVAFEDEPDELTGLDGSLTSRREFAPRRQRTVIRFDGRTYTLEEFRAWVRHLRDVELSTDPEQAGVVERLREQARRQEETASAVVGMLSARDRERWEDLRRVTAERDALIAEKASTS